VILRLPPPAVHHPDTATRSDYLLDKCFTSGEVVIVRSKDLCTQRRRHPGKATPALSARCGSQAPSTRRSIPAPPGRA
jgi:hypothetical protein